MMIEHQIDITVFLKQMFNMKQEAVVRYIIDTWGTKYMSFKTPNGIW